MKDEWQKIIIETNVNFNKDINSFENFKNNLKVQERKTEQILSKLT